MTGKSTVRYLWYDNSVVIFTLQMCTITPNSHPCWSNGGLVLFSLKKSPDNTSSIPCFHLLLKKIPNKINISLQTLQSVSMRTHFLSAAASATYHAKNHSNSSTVTPGLCWQKRIPPPNSDDDSDDEDNEDDVEEVMDAHFAAAALDGACVTLKTSTVTPSAPCRKWDLPNP